MRRNTLLVLTLLVIATLAAVGWNARAQGASKVTWEYKVVASHAVVTPAKLNELGDEGWELVWVSTTEDRIGNLVTVKKEYYFKRAK